MMIANSPEPSMKVEEEWSDVKPDPRKSGAKEEEERIEEGGVVEEVDMQHIAQEDEQVSSNHETVSDTFAEGSSNISDWKTDPGNVSPSACN